MLPGGSTDEYPRRTLGDAGVTVYDCEHRTPKAVADGAPYIAIPNIRDGRLDLANVRRISADDYASWTRRTRPQPGDIIVTRRGRVGDSGVVPDGLKCAIGQNLVILRSDGYEVEQAFLRWLVRSPQWWGQVEKFLNVGAVFDSLNVRDFPKFELPIPPLGDQRAIAEVLGALDDKIELNERINATLDEMARALFKSWFVDFDPVRAKAEGRQPSHMDAGSAALFPDSFEDSPLGPIPAGWRASTVGERVEILTGGTPKRSEPAYWDGEVPWASVADVRSGVYVTHTAETITEEGVRRSAAGVLPAESVVVTARGTVGEIALLAQPTAINQSCYALRDRMDSQIWLYRAIEQGIEQMRLATHGSVFDTITKSTFGHLDLVQPVQDAVRAYESIVRPWHDLILSNTRESRTLAELRDTLLPKLISGEIRVGGAEREMGAAV